jgi:hypothetical protein
MKKQPFYFSFLLCAVLLLFSCGKSGGKFKVDNFSNGKAGEVILVLDQKYASQEAQNAIYKALTHPQPALNQIEPLFDVLQFSNNEFSNHFQRHRSIVQFDINPNFSFNSFSIDENVWAKPQVHVYFKGNSMDSLLPLFKQNEHEIINALYNNDLKRVQYFNTTTNDAFIEKKIFEKFGVQITIPNTYIIAREEEDFMWLRFRTTRNDRFIIIYKTPGADLSRKALIAARNEKTKTYIPGAVLGAYPIVAEVFQFPLYNDQRIGTISGAELRGLWESVNDKMGGPFYEFSFMDKANENVISVGGFVYAPDEEKRNYLRDVEAIVKSVR